MVGASLVVDQHGEAVGATGRSVRTILVPCCTWVVVVVLPKMLPASPILQGTKKKINAIFRKILPKMVRKVMKKSVF